MLRYFGIVRPDDGYIGWISHGNFQAWQEFFKEFAHRAPLYDDIKAYEAIGYKCVELEIAVKG